MRNSEPQSKTNLLLDRLLFVDRGQAEATYPPNARFWLREIQSLHLKLGDLPTVPVCSKACCNACIPSSDHRNRYVHLLRRPRSHMQHLLRLSHYKQRRRNLRTDGASTFTPLFTCAYSSIHCLRNPLERHQSQRNTSRANLKENLRPTYRRHHPHYGAKGQFSLVWRQEGSRRSPWHETLESLLPLFGQEPSFVICNRAPYSHTRKHPRLSSEVFGSFFSSRRHEAFSTSGNRYEILPQTHSRGDSMTVQGCSTHRNRRSGSVSSRYQPRTILRACDGL